MPPAAIVAAVSALAYVAIVARDLRGPARALKVVPALALATLMPTPALVAAMVLCAAGDAFLLDKERFLLAGLGAFLLGHLAFVFGFPAVAERPADDWMFVALLVAVTVVLTQVLPRAKGVMKVAVPLYAAVLLAMAWSATMLGPLGYAGGLLFLVSDALLSVNLFRRPLPGGHVAVMITYYAALMLLTAAVLT